MLTVLIKKKLKEDKRFPYGLPRPDNANYLWIQIFLSALNENGSEKLTKEHFPKGKYGDIDGLCRVATIDQIKGHGYSLNPGRYVGVAEKEEEGIDFYERLEELNEELEKLNAEAKDMEERIAENVAKLLEGGSDI